MLSIRSVVKHYRSGDETIRVLDGLSMSVGAGELMALYGPSGSGKTTLLMVVAGLTPLDSGSVLVGGRDVSRLSRGEATRYRRVDLGYVTQGPDLLAGASAVDNAALKLLGLRLDGARRGLNRREAHARVLPLLERLGLGGRLEHQPHQLSTGERQRVSIARALSTEPTLILADEPTGNLDTKRSHEVLTLLSDVCRERDVALLLVTHDPQAASFADQRHELRDGGLIAYERDPLLNS